MSNFLQALGSQELLLLLSIIIIITTIIYNMGKNAGEKKVYKEFYKKENTPKSHELVRLEKLLADKLITQEEFEILKNKLK